MKLGIVLDNKINKWAIQRFEPLRDKADITVFIGEKNDYDTSSIDLNKKNLTHVEEAILAAKEPGAAYRRVIRVPFKKMDFYYFSLKKYLKGFDIVYSCDLTRSAYTLSSLKDEIGFKIVLSWWENIPFRAALDEKTNFQKRFIMDKVDMFLPFTETAKRVLIMEDVPEEKIGVIYPGVNLARFKPDSKPETMMAKNNISMKSFVILYVGKLVSWKGVHNLIYAAKVLKDKGIKDFVVAVVGKGAQKENMEKLIKESGTEENFRFLDFVSYNDMPDVYRMADIFVLPSYPTMTWQEQFGMVLIEAMASGKLVIASGSGSIPEVIGDAGITFIPGDFYKLADKIAMFMEKREFIIEFGEKGRRRAEDCFDADKNSVKLYDVCSQVLNR